VRSNNKRGLLFFAEQHREPVVGSPPTFAFGSIDTQVEIRAARHWALLYEAYTAGIIDDTSKKWA
jgi:hypothetical protein